MLNVLLLENLCLFLLLKVSDGTYKDLKPLPLLGQAVMICFITAELLLTYSS